MVKSCEYEVEALLDKRVESGVAFYHVKWANYALSDATWEPISHLEGSMELVREFEEKQGRRLKVAKKCAVQSKREGEWSHTRKATSPVHPSIFNIENWHITADLSKKQPGNFRKNSVKRVLRLYRNRGGQVLLDVEWKPKGDLAVGDSTVSLEEFTENEPKTLIEYLASLV